MIPHLYISSHFQTMDGTCSKLMKLIQGQSLWSTLHPAKEKIVLALLNDFFPGEVLANIRKRERSLRDLEEKRMTS